MCPIGNLSTENFNEQEISEVEKLSINDIKTTTILLFMYHVNRTFSFGSLNWTLTQFTSRYHSHLSKKKISLRKCRNVFYFWFSFNLFWIIYRSGIDFKNDKQLCHSNYTHKNNFGYYFKFTIEMEWLIRYSHWQLFGRSIKTAQRLAKYLQIDICVR